MKNIFVLIKDNQFEFLIFNKKENSFSNPIVLNFNNKSQIPFVPPYYYDFDLTVLKLRKFYATNFKKKLVKSKILCTIPDDTTMIEQRVLIESFQTIFRQKSLLFINKCELVQESKAKFISITSSIRAIAVSLFENGSIINQMFLNIATSTISEVKNAVSNLSSEFSSEIIPVYSYNIPEKFAVGEVVEDSKIIENAKHISNIMF